MRLTGLVLLPFLSCSTLLVSGQSARSDHENVQAGDRTEKSGGEPRHVRFASDYNWVQTPTSPSALSAGTNSITLAPCPRGLTITDPDIGAPTQYVYIAGPGSPEAVLVMGGTVQKGGSSCTINIRTAYQHGAGYKIGSASGGIKEASEDALFQVEPYGFGYRRRQGGLVVVDALGSPYKAYAPIYVEGSNQQIEFSGGVLECYVSNQDCFITGDGQKSVRYTNIAVTGLRARPMAIGNTGSMIYDQANKSTFRNIGTVFSSTKATFGHYVTICDDQAFTLDGLQQFDGNNLRTDAAFVGSAIYAPGPFNICSANGWITHVDLTLDCHGNGVDWNSGNNLRISDSVIQGWSQFGLRGGLKRGGYANIEWQNVYEESGRCPNPVGNIGSAGVIQQGGVFKQSGGIGPQGRMPQFSNNGPIIYEYWIVMHHPSYGDSLPLPAGYARSDGKSAVTVKWAPDGRGGADQYKILRKTWERTGDKTPPYGSGKFLVGQVSAKSACTATLCTFADQSESPAAFAVVGISSPSIYYPVLDLWPGDLVLSSGNDTNNEISTATGHLDKLPQFVVAEVHPKMASVFVQDCNPALGGGGDGPVGIIRFSCQSIQGSQNTHFYGGLVLPNSMIYDGGHDRGLKGRLNFLTMGTGPLDAITWFDSNPEKTLTNPWARPDADPADAATGIYDALGTILYDRAKTEIRSYIGKAPDKTPQESLTTVMKKFSVPVRVQPDSDVPAIIVKQANAPSPTADIFQVQDKEGDVKVSVNKSGHLKLGGTATITLGAAGTPTGSCVTGSFYTRSDGGPGSTLYVCENGNWVSK